MTDRLKILIVVQSLLSARTVASLTCSHLKSSNFNSARLWKIMFSSGKGMTERPERWWSDFKVAVGVKPLVPESLQG